MTFAKSHEVSDENKPFIGGHDRRGLRRRPATEFATAWKQPSATEDEQDGVSRGRAILMQ